MLLAMKVKAAVLLGALGALAAPVAAMMGEPPATDRIDSIVEIAPAIVSYRRAGDFSRGGKPVDGPLRAGLSAGSLKIMKQQVTAAEYARCIDDGGCPRVALPDGSRKVPI